MATPASKTLDPEIKALLDGLRSDIGKAPSAAQYRDQQTQLDALESKISHRHFGDSSSFDGSTVIDKFKNNDDVARVLRDKRGSAVITLTGKDASDFMSRKAIVSGIATGSSEGDPLIPVGLSTSGVLQFDRDAGITLEAREMLTIRAALPARPTTMAAIDYVKVLTPMGIASPVPEASVKPENSVGFTSQSEKVRTIATWIPATKQVLDDMTELMGFIMTSIPYYIGLEEELQLLAGDSTGENLHGLIPQAMAFDVTQLSASQGYNRIDCIGRAIEQIVVAKELTPTFCVMHPRDWWSIRLLKDAFGRYLIADPQSSARAALFDLMVIPTTSMPAGSFLVGSGNPAASEIRDRQEIIVEISTQHSDFFTRNLVAVRGERRLALVCKRPNSYCYGSFVSSPA